MDPNEIVSDADGPDKQLNTYRIQVASRQLLINSTIAQKFSWLLRVMRAYVQRRLQELKNYLGDVKIDIVTQIIKKVLGSAYQLYAIIFTSKPKRKRSYSTGDAHSYEKRQETKAEQRRSRPLFESRTRNSWEQYFPDTSSEEEDTSVVTDEPNTSTMSTAESYRLNQLEMQLTELRKQMNSLLASQGMSNDSKDSVNPTIVTPASNLNEEFASSVPPPAPPLLPLFYKPAISNIKPGDLREIKLKHVPSGDSLKLTSDIIPTIKSNSINMKEILKDLDKVQLNPVPKSPSGTPLVRFNSVGTSTKRKSQTNLPTDFKEPRDKSTILIEGLRKIRKEVRSSESFNTSENECSTDEEDLWQL